MCDVFPLSLILDWELFSRVHFSGTPAPVKITSSRNLSLVAPRGMRVSRKSWFSPLYQTPIKHFVPIVYIPAGRHHGVVETHGQSQGLHCGPEGEEAPV